MRACLCALAGTPACLNCTNGGETAGGWFAVRMPRPDPVWVVSMPTGWICPKCGRVLAPDMQECPCYKNDAK